MEGGQGLQVHGQPTQHPGQEAQRHLGAGRRDPGGRSVAVMPAGTYNDTYLNLTKFFSV